MSDTIIQSHDLYVNFYLKLASLNKNLKVLDLACGDGWAGKNCLTLGFESVTFADARPWRLVKPEQHTNWTISTIDIESKDFEHYIKEFEVVIYFGHLYHSIDPNAIIDSIAKSKCKHLFLESKTLGLEDIDEFGPARIVNEVEPSGEEEAAFSSEDKLIEICRPSLSWTKQKLSDCGFKIESIDTGVLINKKILGDNTFGQYFIHATR